MAGAKEQNALKTMGEVSNDLGIAPHVLRFWETKFIQIKPQKRRGRRYFRNEDVITIQTIKELLYDKGYTIKGVQRFFKGQSTIASNTELLAEPSTTQPENSIAEVYSLEQIYLGLRAARDRLASVA